MSPALAASFADTGVFAEVTYKIKGEIRATDKGYKHFRSSKPTVDLPLIKRLVVKADWGHVHQNDYVIVTRNNRLNVPA